MLEPVQGPWMQGLDEVVRREAPLRRASGSVRVARRTRAKAGPPAVLEAPLGPANGELGGRSFWATVQSQVHRTMQDEAKNADATMAAQSAMVLRFYRALHARGYAVATLEAVGRRHALVYLKVQAQKGVAENTARTEWAILNRWFCRLGKPETIGKWEEVLAVYRQESDRGLATGMRKKTSRARRSPPVEKLDEITYQRLLQGLQTDERDLTWYWMVRLVREAGFSREEAVLFQPELGMRMNAGFLTLTLAKSRPSRVVRITDALQDLVTGLKAWWAQFGRRKHLKYDRDSVGEAQQAYAYRLRKHMARVLDGQASGPT